MRPHALVLLLAVSSISPLHAAEPARADAHAPVAPNTTATQRPASKNAFGQAMAELARGLRNVRPAEATQPRTDASVPCKPPTVAAVEPAAGG